LPFRTAAKRSGFSYSALRSAHFRGELAVIRIGAKRPAWYVSVDELVRFVARHTQRMAG
jgi:hypothetical protein